MRPPKYPLEPLAELRDMKVDLALGELAGARRAREATERERVASEQKSLAHAGAADRARRAETEALERGDLRVADLACAHAWEVRVSSERRALTSELERARASDAGARAAEDQAGQEAVSRQ